MLNNHSIKTQIEISLKLGLVRFTILEWKSFVLNWIVRVDGLLNPTFTHNTFIAQLKGWKSLKH